MTFNVFQHDADWSPRVRLEAHPALRAPAAHRQATLGARHHAAVHELLMAEFEVSRVTVREGISLLAEEGDCVRLEMALKP